ncbi:hypothetical protein BDZ91DRAFT_714038 [Kalaharituber pfeilii]|nr:hypothetical protein BDZ91DRAFT_714038 [Kalaharituber pfeilii]
MYCNVGTGLAHVLVWLFSAMFRSLTPCCLYIVYKRLRKNLSVNTCATPVSQLSPTLFPMNNITLVWKEHNNHLYPIRYCNAFSWHVKLRALL